MTEPPMDIPEWFRAAVGGAAHAHWWSHIAPTFLPDYRLDAWCDEVAAVIAAGDFPAPAQDVYLPYAKEHVTGAR